MAGTVNMLLQIIGEFHAESSFFAKRRKGRWQTFNHILEKLENGKKYCIELCWNWNFENQRNERADGREQIRIRLLTSASEVKYRKFPIFHFPLASWIQLGDRFLLDPPPLFRFVSGSV